MKRLFICLIISLCPASLSQLFAGEEYQENMDSLLHQVKGHRQGIVLLDEEGVKLKVYLSCEDIASNGKHYYRWWTGNFLYSINPDRLPDTNGAEPLSYGYRFDDEKIYVFNFLSNLLFTCIGKVKGCFYTSIYAFVYNRIYLDGFKMCVENVTLNIFDALTIFFQFGNVITDIHQDNTTTNVRH